MKSQKLVPLLFALLFASSSIACAGGSKLDYSRLFVRAGWQKPDAVIEAMDVAPGQHVADIGAGDGYFTFRLAEKVGESGRVYAVEVDEEKLIGLMSEVAERGVVNVEVVRGEFEDPMLPDGRIDRVLLVNTYHHIEGRPEYFRKLVADLAPGGSVTSVDIRDDLSGIPRLLATEGHWSNLEEVHAEMRQADYASSESFDFLMMQSLEVFVPQVDLAGEPAKPTAP